MMKRVNNLKKHRKDNLIPNCWLQTWIAPDPAGDWGPNALGCLKPRSFLNRKQPRWI